MIRIFPVTLAANEVRTFNVSGEYFEIRNALYPVDVELLDRSGGIVSLLEQAEQSDFVKPGLYETVRVTNGPTAQTVRFFYGSGDAGSRRTSGVVRIDGTSAVSVIDGEALRTAAGGNYFGLATGPSVAGQYSMVQLWNPVGTGKNIILQQITGAGSAAGSVVRYTNNAALATNATANFVSNKLAGAGLGAAQIRYSSSAAFPSSYAMQQPPSAGWLPGGNVVLPPGFGFVTVSDQLNTFCIANFEWYES